MVTEGTLSARTKSRTRAPSSPPQILYSCWIETTPTHLLRARQCEGSRRARPCGSDGGPRSDTSTSLGQMKGDDLAVAGAGREVSEGGNSAVSWRIRWRRRQCERWRDSSLASSGALRRTVAGRCEWSTTVAERDRCRLMTNADLPRCRPAGAAGPGDARRIAPVRPRAFGALLDSNWTRSPPTSRSKSSEESRAAAMEEVFPCVLGGDEAEAAVGDDLLDGTGGHEDLQHFPNRRSRAHGPFEKGSTTLSRCWTQRPRA